MQGVVAPEDLLWVVIVAGVFMALMAFSIGANDLANAFGPAVGSGCVSVRQACAIAAVCDAAGAILMGGHVSKTIPGKLITLNMYEGDDGRVLIMIGMTSALIAASFWILMATKFAIPVSTTHAIVGGVIATGILTKGYPSANWTKVGQIVASWFVSPAFAGVVGFGMYMGLHYGILKHEDSERRAKRAGPVLVFVVSFVVALFILYQGGKGLGLNKTSPEVAIGASFGVAVLLAVLSVPVLSWWDKRLKGQQEEAPKDPESAASAEAAPPPAVTEGSPDQVEVQVEEVPPEKRTVSQVVRAQYSQTERLFMGFVVANGGFFAIAHGANDVANSVGPFGAALAAHEGPMPKELAIPFGYYIASGLFIALGLITYGANVMNTIGRKITLMVPSKAFAADFSCTMCTLVATRLGIPVSTTHLEVGAVVGMGVAYGMVNKGKAGAEDETQGSVLKSVNWFLLIKVFTSWIFTLPLAGITAAGIFAMLLPTVVDVPFT